MHFSQYFRNTNLRSKWNKVDVNVKWMKDGVIEKHGCSSFGETSPSHVVHIMAYSFRGDPHQQKCCLRRQQVHHCSSCCCQVYLGPLQHPCCCCGWGCCCCCCRTRSQSRRSQTWGTACVVPVEACPHQHFPIQHLLILTEVFGERKVAEVVVRPWVEVDSDWGLKGEGVGADYQREWDPTPQWEVLTWTRRCGCPWVR